MNGRPIAGVPIGISGLGALATDFPGARAEAIRIDAALAIAGETASARVDAARPAVADPAPNQGRP